MNHTAVLVTSVLAALAGLLAGGYAARKLMLPTSSSYLQDLALMMSPLLALPLLAVFLIALYFRSYSYAAQFFIEFTATYACTTVAMLLWRFTEVDTDDVPTPRPCSRVDDGIETQALDRQQVPMAYYRPISTSYRLPGRASRYVRHLHRMRPLLGVVLSMFVSAPLIYCLSAHADGDPLGIKSNASKGNRYVEPTLIAKIIDVETAQPVQGAFIYGYYATSEGTLAGGTKGGEHVKSFMVQTDASGVFRLEGFDTGARLIGGERRGRFPSISIYKPGYDLELTGFDTIDQWGSNSRQPGASATRSASIVDWSAYPYTLRPIKSEQQRYNALDGAGRSIWMEGECGWETYAPLLLAMHNELKDWYAKNLPKSELATSGYPKPNARIPDEWRPANVMFSSVADTITKQFLITKNTWKCKNPTSAFGTLK